MPEVEKMANTNSNTLSSFYTLHIEYYTRWGEQIYVCFDHAPRRGRVVPADALPLSDIEGCRWSLQVPEKYAAGSSYSYCLVQNGLVTRTEWQAVHKLPALPEAAPTVNGDARRVMSVQLFDLWCDTPADLPFYSSAFTQSIFRRTESEPVTLNLTAGSPGTLTICCEAASLQPGQRLAVCGNTQVLGNWQPEQAAIMTRISTVGWTVSVSHADCSYPICFKFVIFDPTTKQWSWESGDNRTIVPLRQPAKDEVLWTGFYQLNNPLPRWRGAGVAVPVFSLRTEADAGIGEFNDLRLLTDWCVRTGQRVIQILPVNDTTITRTWRDSYPYNSNSTFALNPLYIHLEDVGELTDEAERKTFNHRREQLNRLPTVDFEQVMELKWSYLRRLYIFNGERDMTSADYQEFYEHNRYWLDDYAVYSYLRDKYNTAHFNEWNEQYSPELVARLSSPDSTTHNAIGFYKYIQFHLHRQLSEARRYAHAHGIILKGDIPIGISRYSVDAWVHPSLFHLDCQAGAPPDSFDCNGQNWGFPTYNWQAMADEGYCWFRERFAKMAEYFDAYRIDHILGFFRIWEVPMHAVQGLLGYFNPATPLTAEEMMRDYGFRFDAEQLLPYVTDDTLEEIFADDAALLETVKHKFLDIRMPTDTRYHFCPRFATQRSVEGYFRSRPESVALKKQLFGMLTDVLFIEDPHKPGRFHPRINGIDTYAFKALPADQQAAYRHLHEDFFYHRHNDFWRDEAMRKLPVLLQATPMLACGEDLGMIPSCVPNVMHDLRILSLKIQRMPKGFVEFGDPKSYPYYSVCTTSSHDLSNIRVWWEEDPERTQRYFRDMLKGVGQAPEKAEPWICAKIIDEHLEAPSMLAILPIQDWLAIDGQLRHPHPTEERINTPSNPDNYWHYRLHLSLEKLLTADSFNRQVKKLIVKHGRCH
jgi:4-alpha-glucanotransferase